MSFTIGSRLKHFFVLVPCLLVLAQPLYLATSLGADQDNGPLTLENVLDLKRAGVGDDLIIDRIRKTGTSIELTIKQIIDLKHKGLSDALISAMLPRNEDTKSMSPTPVPTTVVQSTSASAGPVPENTTEQPASSSESAAEQNPEAMINVENQPERTIFKISSKPLNARVYIDNRLVGTTPYYTNMAINGKFELTLKKEFYRDLKVNVDLVSESIQDLHLEMRLEQPLVVLEWLTDDPEFVKSFKWSARNCQIAASEHMVKLESLLLEHEYKENYTISLAQVKEITNEDVSCLEFFVWFKSTWAQRRSQGTMPQPDLHFLITDIPLIFEEPVALKLALQYNNRYPQGTRIILTSQWGKLYRIDPKRSAEKL